MCACEQGTCLGGCPCGCSHFLLPEVDWSSVSVGADTIIGRRYCDLGPISRPDPNDVEAVEAFLA